MATREVSQTKSYSENTFVPVTLSNNICRWKQEYGFMFWLHGWEQICLIAYKMEAVLHWKLK